MDTTDYTNKAPYLNEEEENEQVTIDEWYYNDLIKIAKLTKQYFDILSFPMEKTNDELLEIYAIKTKLKKLL